MPGYGSSGFYLDRIYNILKGTGKEGDPISLTQSSRSCLLKDVTLTLDTAQYADGDVLAATQEIPDVLLDAGGSVYLSHIIIEDDDKQSGALDLVLFRSNVDIGTENDAYSITDAEMNECIGYINVAAADYTSWTNNSSVFYRNTDPAMKIGVITGAVGTKSLWIAGISRGTKTYSANGIKLKLGFAY